MKYVKYILCTLKNIIIFLRLQYYCLGSKSNNRLQFINSFKDKSVVIIGPAESYTQELDHQLAKCDIIVLINKGYRNNIFNKYQKHGKIIVLFHCLDENENGGCGVIDYNDLNNKCIDRIYYPLNEFKLSINVLFFLKKYRNKLKLIWIDREDYRTLKKNISGYIPNTGFAALYSIYICNPSKLYVHGLTFHRTAYLPEYNKDGEDLNKNIEIIERGGNHNPDEDWKYFLRLYSQGKIEISPLLKKLVDQPYQQLFYLKNNEQI